MIIFYVSINKEGGQGFIKDANLLQKSTIDLVESQFESSVRELVDLNKILLSDIRYARLFPLLCTLKDASVS